MHSGDRERWPYAGAPLCECLQTVQGVRNAEMQPQYICTGPRKLPENKRHHLPYSAIYGCSCHSTFNGAHMRNFRCQHMLIRLCTYSGIIMQFGWDSRARARRVCVYIICTHVQHSQHASLAHSIHASHSRSTHTTHAHTHVRPRIASVQVRAIFSDTQLDLWRTKGARSTRQTERRVCTLSPIRDRNVCSNVCVTPPASRQSPTCGISPQFIVSARRSSRR